MFQLQTHNSKMISFTGQKQPLPHSPHVPLHHKDKGVWDAGVSSFALKLAGLSIGHFKVL